jgi:hypothetical protein
LTTWRFPLRFAGLLCSLCLTFASAFAQQGPPSDADKLVSFLYKDPRPERLSAFLVQYENARPDGKWDAYPPIAGLLAVTFRNHPDQIENLIPSALGPKTAATVVAALQLSGNAAAIQRIRPRLQGVARDDQLAVEFANLPPRIEDLQIASPTHLDILWGASFAGGDPRFVQPIIGFYARTADRSEAIAIDVLKTAIGIAGGPPGPKLGPIYGNDLGREIVFAAIALWAIRSNCRQHVFVDEAVAKYIDDHPGTSATKGLIAATRRRI